MRITLRDGITWAAGAAVLFALWRLRGWVSAAGEKAGDLVEAGYLTYLNAKSPTPKPTAGAEASREEWIRRGYMTRVYVPFKGCEGDACYRYKITPAGEAYIAQQKRTGQ